jgi:acyl-CoA thioester hydrolase
MLIEHTYNIKIDEKWIDASRHVNNANYMTILENARWDIFKNTEFSKDKMHALGFAPVLIDCYIRYRKELVSGEKIKINTQVISVEKNGTIYIKQTIFNEEGRKACSAKVRHGLIDLEKRALMPMKSQWLDILLNK